jgi:hypothetical protein
MTPNIPTASSPPTDAFTAASLASFRHASCVRSGEAAFSFDPVKFNTLLAGWTA